MTYHRVKQMRVDRSEETRAWRDLRAAGQGVRAIRRFLTLAEAVAELQSGDVAARSTP